MTDAEINVAIAEACGWKDCGDGDGEFSHLWRYRHPTLPSRKDIPDYCADLNAMAGVEKVLTTEQWEPYEFWIGHFVCQNEAGHPWSPRPIHATARQRAEAFLRTVGKWKEGGQ